MQLYATQPNINAKIILVVTSGCLFCPSAPSGETVYLMNKQGKGVCYRFVIDLGSLEENDGFIARIKYIKQPFSSFGTMLVCDWLAVALFELFGIFVTEFKTTCRRKCKIFIFFLVVKKFIPQ